MPMGVRWVKNQVVATLGGFDKLVVLFCESVVEKTRASRQHVGQRLNAENCVPDVADFGGAVETHGTELTIFISYLKETNKDRRKCSGKPCGDTQERNI